MPELVYPMTLNYVKHWTPWDVVREFVSNAMDASPVWSCYNDGTLHIHDEGAGVAVKHLLLGVTEKPTARPRGQFGEGLDLALLCLTRMGMTAHIHTPTLHLWNKRAHIEGIDEDVLSIQWEEGTFPIIGTTVTIPGWTDPTYAERFIMPNDSRIVYTDPAGRSILRMEHPAIHVRNVWVCDSDKVGRNYAFGYDLMDAQMNRDRGVVDTWSVSCEIGRLWGTVKDPGVLEEFWQAVKDNCGERNCQMRIENTEQSRFAFRKVFGQWAVGATGDAMAREAAYRGAKVLTEGMVGWALMDAVKALVGTDGEYVELQAAEAAILVPDRHLPPEQRKSLGLLRRLAARARHYGRVDAYTLVGADGQAANGGVRISKDILLNLEHAVGILLHELAHLEFKAEDVTVNHIQAIYSGPRKPDTEMGKDKVQYET